MRNIFTEIEEKSVELPCDTNTDQDYLNLFINKLQQIFEIYIQYVMQQITVRIHETKNLRNCIKLPSIFITKTLISLLAKCEGITKYNGTGMSIININVLKLQEQIKNISCRLRGTNRYIRVCNHLNLNISNTHNVYVTKFQYYMLPMDSNCIDIS